MIKHNKTLKKTILHENPLRPEKKTGKPAKLPVGPTCVITRHTKVHNKLPSSRLTRVRSHAHEPETRRAIQMSGRASSLLQMRTHLCSGKPALCQCRGVVLVVGGGAVHHGSDSTSCPGALHFPFHKSQSNAGGAAARQSTSQSVSQSGPAGCSNVPLT